MQNHQETQNFDKKEYSLNDSETGEVTRGQKNIKQKCSYKKINNQTRQQLIEMVYLKDYLLKDASKILGINYSTAKTILRIFRIEKRIEKKNTVEDLELKEIIDQFKKEKLVKNLLFAQSFRKNSFKSTTLSSGSSEGNNNNQSSLQKTSEISEHNMNLTNLIKIANDSKSLVNDCFNELQKNQMMIEYLMTSLNNFNQEARSLPQHNLYFSQRMQTPHPEYDPNELIKRVLNFNSTSADNKSGILKVNEAEMVRSPFTSRHNLDTTESFVYGKASL